MYILIGSQHSLYTGKLRAYMKWKGLPFEEVIASANLYRQVILPRTGVAYIPVLVCPDNTTVLQDTHAIISSLEQQHPQHPILPSTPKQRFVSMLLELYGDEHVVIPAMHYRWSFPEQHTTYMHYQFGKTTAPNKPYDQQLAAGEKVARHFANMLPLLGITPATVPVIEARFAWQLAVLQQHLKQHSFLLSSNGPCSGDFGMMGPLYAHLYIDPIPDCLMKCTAPLVADWVERTCGISAVRARAGFSPIVELKPVDQQQPAAGPLRVTRAQQQEQHQAKHAGTAQGLAAVHDSRGSSSGSSSSSSSSSSRSSTFPPGDVVPPTLLPLLHHMFQELMPFVCSTLHLLKDWVQQQQQQQEDSSPGNSSSSSCQRGSVPGQQPSVNSGRSSNKGRNSHDLPAGWLAVPRGLGFCQFDMFDPATGRVAVEGRRSASSYVAWRAAELVAWVEGLQPADSDAVQQLLHDISKCADPSAAAAAAGAATATAVAQQAAAVTAAAVAAGLGAPNNHQAAAITSGAALQAAGPVLPVGGVDAAVMFTEVMRLVKECGQVARMHNRVVVKPAAGVMATANHGGRTLSRL